MPSTVIDHGAVRPRQLVPGILAFLAVFVSSCLATPINTPDPANNPDAGMSTDFMNADMSLPGDMQHQKTDHAIVPKMDGQIHLPEGGGMDDATSPDSMATDGLSPDGGPLTEGGVVTEGGILSEGGISFDM